MAKATSLLSACEFLKFVDASPSPYHVVQQCKNLLVAAGFKELNERNHWEVKPLDRCFVTRNQSTILAFAVGGSYKPGNGFSVVGAHTDSPCLRVKVKSTREKQGFIQVGTECYGGGNWNSWFDRDLKIAGRVLVADSNNRNNIKSVLVNVDRPILRVPHLAIHLQREMNEKFSINKEIHLVPILATQAEFELNKPTDCDITKGSCASKHHSVFVNLLAKECKVDAKNIVDLDLFLADHQPSAIGGLLEEFIFAPRLDNLLCSYGGVRALIDSCGNLQSDPNIRMVSLFDNEEVGSSSAQGACSSISEYIMRRLSVDPNNPTSFEESIPKSFMMSADMVHGVHPNYSEKHEENLRPSFHGGPTIKTNNNQRYATTALTATVVREAARLVDIPIQDVMVRNDSACGSTIGPLLSTRLGMRTVDLGLAQLSMHSCREMCGVYAPEQCTKLMKSFFENFSTIDANLNCE